MTTNKGGGDGRGGGGGNSGDVAAVPPKLARTEAFPFRMLSHPFGTENGLGPTYWNGSSGGMLGGSDICTYDGVPATAAAAATARSLQPFPISTPVRSPGIMASFRYPFTSAQWQELERQALIYKCMIASVPIPPELLIPRNAPPALSSRPHLVTQAAGSCFNLRFSNNADPEPGRCRRTDGKKWRCSRDVAPDQKYCERHMHRGRPRSRKPVEVQPQSNRNARSNPSTNASSLITSSLAANSTFPNLPTTSSAAAASQQLSSGLCARKLPPYQNTVVPSALPVDKEPRYLEWMRGQPDWQLMEEEAKMGLRSCGEGGNDDPAVLQPPQYEDHLINLNFASNFGNGASEPYLNSDLSGLEDSNIQRDPPRRFIDAWSISSAAPRDTPAAAAATPKIINSKNISLSSSGGGKVLPMSSLTLSMPSSNDEELDHIQMGLSVTDSEERQSGGSRPKYWSSGSSLPWLVSPPLGGPLGEVLQSSTTAAGSNSASPHGSCGGLNLMMGERWGEEGSSPRERSPARVASSSSPTGVLQKTLASLSDSSGSSSPTFGAAAATKPQGPALQWPLNDRTKFPSS